MTEQEALLFLETNWWMIKLCIGIGAGIGAGLGVYWGLGTNWFGLYPNKDNTKQGRLPLGSNPVASDKEKVR